jgi:hypothetical protein
MAVHPVMKKVQQCQIEGTIRRKQMVVDSEIAADRFGSGQMLPEHSFI